MVVVALLIGLLTPQPPMLDAVSVEARRLASEAAQRGSQAGGAVDLIRLAALEEWLPPSLLAQYLTTAGEDASRAPLVRAVAWYLLHNQAIGRLDMETAGRARERLGLLDDFVMRPGPAPKPLAKLSPEGWQTYPKNVGVGVVWLEAFLRPARETRATLASDIYASGGLAVLRLGYDDAVTVWLNGDEIYKSRETHGAWLDQAAALVQLRPGKNRLMVEVRQKSGAWRLLARVTDLAGNPLPVTAKPTPWGPPPEPADGPLIDDYEHLWTTLNSAIDADPPVARNLRDLAVYAHRTGLPNEDQSLLRVAMLGAWEDDESPETLWSWLQLLSEEERAGIRSGREFRHPVTAAGHFAALRIQLGAAWNHFYAGRTGASVNAVERLSNEAPTFLPALQLSVAIDHDLGLAHTALGRLKTARTRWGDRPGLVRGYLTGVRGAGMITPLQSALDAITKTPQSDPAFMFELAVLSASRGQPDRAVALLDRVVAARPELWRYGLEAADILRGAGRLGAAQERLEAMWTVRKGDPSVATGLALLHETRGKPNLGIPPLKAALARHPGNPDLKTRLEAISAPSRLPPLGPSLDELAKTKSPTGPMAHVLYHHAWAEVGDDGRANRRIRRVVRLLTPEGARRFGVVELTYAPGTQNLRIFTAHLIRTGRPPASPVRSDKALSEPEYRLYYDLRAEVLSFARPQPGDLVELEWTVEDTDPDPAFPGYFGELSYLQEGIPRSQSIVEIVGASAAKLEAVATPHGIDITQNGLRFEARNVPGVPYEPDMPGPSSSRAHVHFSTVKSWGEVDETYQRLLAGRDEPTPALADQAKLWVGDARDPKTVFRRLYAAVSGRLRYVGLEFGIHSFQPELPSVTLARGYGDCKDKATVLIAAARALGHQAHLTLVRTRGAGSIGSEPPSLAVFDHAVVYVPSLGRFLDPTVDRNDPWTLPPSDHGAVAFVVGAPDAPRLIPPMAADESVDQRELDLRVNDKGRFVGQAKWTTRGQPGSEIRRLLEAKGTRRVRVSRTWSDLFPGVEVENVVVRGIEPAFDPVVAEATVDLGPARTLPVGGAPWHLIERFAENGDRKLPLEISFRRTEALTLQIEVPKGGEVKGPPAAEVSSRFGRFTLESKITPERVGYTSRFALDTLVVAPEDYGAFRTWLSEIERILSSPVEVRHP